MKLYEMSIAPKEKNWLETVAILKQIFTFFTGYDIMPAASRKDLLPEPRHKPENTAIQKNTRTGEALEFSNKSRGYLIIRLIKGI